MRRLDLLRVGQRPDWHQYNALVNRVNALSNVQGTGGARASLQTHGIVVDAAGAGGGGGNATTAWYQISATSANPMIGYKQTADSAGSFSRVTGSSASSIYWHPSAEGEYYDEGSYVYASYVGSSWVSVNMFTSAAGVIERTITSSAFSTILTSAVSSVASSAISVVFVEC